MQNGAGYVKVPQDGKRGKIHRMQKRLLWAWLLTLGVVHALNIPTALNGLQLETWWLDIPFHLFGGMGVGLFALWFGVWRGFLPTAENGGWLAGRMRVAFPDGAPWWWSFLFVAAITAIIGLTWEIYEVFIVWYFNLQLPSDYLSDTVKDLFLDMAGATTAWAAIRYNVKYGTRRK
jgi:hypothetical protein